MENSVSINHYVGDLYFCRRKALLKFALFLLNSYYMKHEKETIKNP